MRMLRILIAPLSMTKNSTTYIPRVETSRYRRVRCAFDDGPAVGEKSHLVGILPELQNEVGVADRAMRLQAAIQFGEVDGSLALMDLHGIPAAQGDVRATLAGKVNEVVLAAGAAAGTRFGGGDFSVLIRPDIEGKKGAAKVRGGCSGDQNFQRLCCCDRRHQIYRRIQNARRLARFDHAARRIRKDAGQARGFAGNDIQGHGITSYRGGINPR